MKREVCLSGLISNINNVQQRFFEIQLTPLLSISKLKWLQFMNSLKYRTKFVFFLKIFEEVKA